MKQSSRLRHR
uniref:Uncharacterized protein n=1 Tax=Rhizophora mucronata TaxID=61149 RepID=A0A2P2P5I1_RHIMU